ncbi:Hypothetical protein SCLAV_5081 [Streptomyces clavuligerus]|uniref:Uncharacterized protein n=1 Tax=Streptomyces clavuligerus TaxID=1901 RepID=E2PX77_STRCL|nr:Hypothetical protein SCLAV_5081 [Streptomyces clavuligerus]
MLPEAADGDLATGGAVLPGTRPRGPALRPRWGAMT